MPNVRPFLGSNAGRLLEKKNVYGDYDAYELRSSYCPDITESCKKKEQVVNFRLSGWKKEIYILKLLEIVTILNGSNYFASGITLKRVVAETKYYNVYGHINHADHT